MEVEATTDNVDLCDVDGTLMPRSSSPHVAENSNGPDVDSHESISATPCRQFVPQSVSPVSTATAATPARPPQQMPDVAAKVKVWVKKEGMDDDDALKVSLEADDCISDIVTAAVNLFHFPAGIKAADLQAVRDDDGTPFSNKADIEPLAGMTLIIKERAPKATDRKPAVAARKPLSSHADPVSMTPPRPSSATRRRSSSTEVRAAQRGSDGTSKPPPKESSFRRTASQKQSSTTAASTIRRESPNRRPVSDNSSSVPKPRASTPQRSSTPTRRSTGGDDSAAKPVRASIIDRRNSVGGGSATIMPPSGPVCKKFCPEWGQPMSCGTCKQHRKHHEQSSNENPKRVGSSSSLRKTGSIRRST